MTENKIDNVSIDHFMFAKCTDKSTRLQSRGILHSFGISIVGKDKDGVSLIGVAHTSHKYDIKKVLDMLTRQFVLFGNVIKFPAIQIVSSMTFCGKGVSYLPKQKEVQEIASTSKYNIIKMDFNVNESMTFDEALTMTVSSAGAKWQDELFDDTKTYVEGSPRDSFDDAELGLDLKDKQNNSKNGKNNEGGTYFGDLLDIEVYLKD